MGCSSSVGVHALALAALGCNPSGMTLSDTLALEHLLSRMHLQLCPQQCLLPHASSATFPSLSCNFFLNMCEIGCEQGLPCLAAGWLFLWSMGF